MKTVAYSGLQRQSSAALLAALAFGLHPAGWVSAQEPPSVRPPAPRSRAEVEAVLAKAPPVGADAARRPLHVLLVAGPKDHGPGEHDYPAWQKAWAVLLAKAPGVRVTTAFPWPEPAQWEGVDVVVFYFRGRWDARQLAEIQKHQARGGGVVSVHWAIGCDQDVNKHSEHFGLSYPNKSYRHGPTELRLVKPEHPLLIGLPRSIPFVDEPYWPFVGNRSNVTVLATSDEKINQGDDRRGNPGDDTVEAVPVFWTYERSGSDVRVLVSIFGHYTWTFDDPYFRLMLLRGIAWAAKHNTYRLDRLAVEGVTLAEPPAGQASAGKR